MVNRTALKVGALVGGAVLVVFLLQMVLSWLVRMVQLLGVAVLAGVAAYLVYRGWSWARARGGQESSEGERTTEKATARGDLDATSPEPSSEGGDDGTLTDEEFQRELEELTEES